MLLKDPEILESYRGMGFSVSDLAYGHGVVVAYEAGSSELAFIDSASGKVIWKSVEAGLIDAVVTVDRGFVLVKNFPTMTLLVHYTPSTDQLFKSYSPLKIFEYMAAGKLILAPRQSWIEEILRDGETALLFDEKNPRDLAEKIIRLKQDKELAAKIAKNAKQESLNYTYEKRAENFSRPYIQLIHMDTKTRRKS